MHTLRSCTLLAVVGVALSAAPAWAADPEEDDEPVEHDFTDEDDDEDDEAETEVTLPPADAPRPPPDGSDRPLAVPGPSDTPPNGGRAPGTRSTRVPAAPTSSEPPPRASTDPLMLVDAGYRMVWLGRPYAPRGGGLGPRLNLAHATGSVLLDKSVLIGGSFETPLNPARGTNPFVAEIRAGWWETAFGEPERRGPLRMLPGTKVTYVGVRWVHDHYRGAGGEWAGVADAAGLVLGYAYAAPLGRLTVITDSQFSLYLLGWKNRNSLPIGLLNQRLSIGLDPVFIDARFRSDPATGEELSVGVSFQGLFGLGRAERR